MKVKIEVWGEIELTFNRNSKEFKAALAAYRNANTESANEEDMLNHVAFYITRFGIDSMIEGVGYVGENGRKPPKENTPYSGIMVGEDYDEFAFDLTDGYKIFKTTL